MSSWRTKRWRAKGMHFVAILCQSVGQCPVLDNSALSFAKDIPDAWQRPAMALFECQRYPIILDSCGQSAWFATISHPVVVHGAINVRVVRDVWPD